MKLRYLIHEEPVRQKSWTMEAQRSPFLMISHTFGLGQTNWADKFWGIWGIFGQIFSTILALWVPCPWENDLVDFSTKKWFSHRYILYISETWISLFYIAYFSIQQKKTGKTLHRPFFKSWLILSVVVVGIALKRFSRAEEAWPWQWVKAFSLQEAW